MSQCTTMDSLKMLRNMTSITNLGIIFRYADDKRQMCFTCEAFQRLCGDTLLPKLKELSIAPPMIQYLEGILSKAKSLEKMTIVLPKRDVRGGDVTLQDLQQSGRNYIFARTVGKQLKELSIDYAPSSSYSWPLIIPCLDDKDSWPQLKAVRYENIWDPMTRRESDPICGRANFLKSVYRQHVLHGGYEVRFTKPLELRFPDLVKLTCEDELQIQKAREFIRWISSTNGPDADDIILSTDDFGTLLSGESQEELYHVEKRLLLFYENPIKFRLSGYFAPRNAGRNTQRLMNILTGKIKRLTFSPTGFGRTKGDEAEPHI